MANGPDESGLEDSARTDGSSPIESSLQEVSREERLLIAILRRAPFTAWACDKHYRIQLWSGRCESVYGFSPQEANGANYLDLFVDPVERPQSQEDCDRIINDDYEQSNCLAYDRTKTGKSRTMLTNCFRVWDDERKQWLQAEVGIDISELHMAQESHRTLREFGTTRLQIFDMARAQVRSRLTQVHDELVRRYSDRTKALAREQTRLQRTLGQKVDESLEHEALSAAHSEFARLEEEGAALDRRLTELQRGDDTGLTDVDEDLGRHYERVCGYG